MTNPTDMARAASEMGRKGGSARSEAKTAAARENAKKPRKKRKGTDNSFRAAY